MAERCRETPAIREELCIVWVARRQHGVITTRQLDGIGVTRSGITRRVRSGRLYRKHRGGVRSRAPGSGAGGRILAAVVHSDHALRRAVHEAESLKLVSHGALLAQIDRARPGRAAKRLAAIVADGPRPTRSELEDAVDDMLTRHGIRPPLTNTQISGLPAWVEVDFFYPAARLVIEADGARFHDTPIRQAHDRQRQALLEAHGLQVLRVRWEDAQPQREAQTVARVRHALR